MRRVPRVRRRQPLGFSYRLAVAILWPLMRTIVKWDIAGDERVTDCPGGVVVAPNHLSWFDPPVVAFALWQADRPPRFLGQGGGLPHPDLRRDHHARRADPRVPGDGRCEQRRP